MFVCRVRVCVHLLAVVAVTAATATGTPCSEHSTRHLSIQKFIYAMSYTAIEFDVPNAPEDGHVMPTCNAQVRMPLINMEVAAEA